MYCPKCGVPLQLGEKFCTGCGTPVAGVGGIETKKSLNKALFISAGLVLVVLVSIFIFKGIPGAKTIGGSTGVGSILKTDETSKHARFKDGQLTYTDLSHKDTVTGEDAVEKEGWIYYRNNNGKLEKMKTDGSGKVELCDKRIGTIFVIGDWIYFGSGNIFRVRQDGKELSQISQFTCVNMIINGDWIYAVGSDYDGIYKVKLDGTNEMKITDDKVRNIEVVNDWIFYYQIQHEDRNLGTGLYRIKTDGTVKTLLDNNKTKNPFLTTDGEWIYYTIYYDNDFNDYKMRLNGTEKTKVVYDGSISGYVYKDWFYYKDKSDQYSLYRMRTDGTSKTKLTDNKNIHEYIITHDWIYYNTGYSASEDEAFLYKIRTDGTEKKLLLQESNDMGMNTIHLVGDWIYWDGRIQHFMLCTDGTDRQVLDPPQTVNK